MGANDEASHGNASAVRCCWCYSSRTWDSPLSE